MISPPINQNNHWLGKYTAYTTLKFGVTSLAWGMSLEFREHGIGVNTLWPRTTIGTAGVLEKYGGEEGMRKSRHPGIMADAAYEIMTSNSKKCSGNQFVDEEVLAVVGVTDFEKYKVDKTVEDKDLVPDVFLDA